MTRPPTPGTDASNEPWFYLSYWVTRKISWPREKSTTLRMFANDQSLVFVGTGLALGRVPPQWSFTMAKAWSQDVYSPISL
jgi:hypothetical protein